MFSAVLDGSQRWDWLIPNFAGLCFLLGSAAIFPVAAAISAKTAIGQIPWSLIVLHSLMSFAQIVSLMEFFS
jgi:hypothetical protein